MIYIYVTCIHLHSSENQVTGKTLLATNLVGKGYNYMITPLVCKKKVDKPALKRAPEA